MLSQRAMPEDLIFHMGKFPALLPADLRYARNHMWCRPEEERLRFGFTSYAVRLMQDVYFLDWHVSPGDVVEKLQEIGHIETSKAVADLFAPIQGRLVAINTELLKDPSPINLDNYAAGWLFDMEGPADGTLSAAEYYAFLDQNWEKTQRTLKGHM
jgi:glycine cleavage system H protein